MFDEKRYILVNLQDVTQDMIDACLYVDSVREARFANSPIKWGVLEWKGDKPTELWGEFPVYSAQEMADILRDDLNNKLIPM